MDTLQTAPLKSSILEAKVRLLPLNQKLSHIVCASRGLHCQKPHGVASFACGFDVSPSGAFLENHGLKFLTVGGLVTQFTMISDGGGGQLTP